MIKLDMPIIVEGKYDKIKLSSIVDAVIITTDGFRIFKDTQKVALIRRLAEKKGVIVLTDSDSAGGLIRSHLKSILGDDKIHHLLLPPVKGKEKRKAKPSAEGLLGVEGTQKEVIIKALERFLSTADTPDKKPLTTAFLMSQKLSGCPDSKARRSFLLKNLGLPEGVSPATLKRVLSEISCEEEIIKIMKNYKG